MQTPSWTTPSQTDSAFLDLRDYAGVLRRRKKLVGVVALVAVGCAVAWTAVQPRIYSATAEVLVRPPILAVGDTTSPQTLNVENERQIAMSVPVAALAADGMGGGLTPREMVAATDVTVTKDADVLQVRFSDRDARLAGRGANAIAQAYLEYKTQQARATIDGKVAVLKERLAALAGSKGSSASIALLNQQLAQVQSTTIDAGEVLAAAETPGSPGSPNLPMNVALALFAGMLVGVLVAFARERMDDHLHGRIDLESTIGAPVMTMIPTVPGWRDRGETHLVTLESPRSPAAEAYRTLRTSMFVAAAEHGIKSVMVVSALAGEGKSTTAANLAVTLAQADKKVVLVSADLRRPRVHEFFGLAGDRGLSEVLEGDRRAWESLRSGRIDNLWVMSSGKISSHPTELLQSHDMQELIAEQREVVDFIVIDCPPVLAVADALVLAPLVDCVLYVADAGATPRGAVVQARAQLDQVGARVLGAVLNNVDAGSTGYAYYGAQYGYGEGPAPVALAGDTWSAGNKAGRLGGRLEALRRRSAS